MPNYGDMSPDERRRYLQMLKDMATQQANEGLRGMVSDAQAMEQEYMRNRPDPAAMESARGTDTAKSHMNMLMAALNAGNGNQGAAQVYGRAAGENPEQDALKNKQGAFMDYLKGLSGLKAQKNALSLPFLQKREAEASEALQGFDQQQAQAQQKAADLAQKAEDRKLSREEREDARRQHAALMRELAGGRQADRTAAVEDKYSQKFEEDLSKVRVNYGGWEPEIITDEKGRRHIKSATPKDAEAIKEASISLSNIEGTGQQLMDIMKNNRWGSITPGEEAQVRESLTTILSLDAKSKAMFDLGVLNGPDLGLIRSAIGKSGINWDIISEGGGAARIQTLIDNSRMKLENALKRRGYHLPGGEKAAGSGQAGTVKMRLPSGTIRMIKADSVEAAKKKGAVVVE